MTSLTSTGSPTLPAIIASGTGNDLPAGVYFDAMTPRRAKRIYRALDQHERQCAQPAHLAAFMIDVAPQGNESGGSAHV